MNGKRGPLPIYYVIEKDLEEIILDCEMNTKLPTEEYLMKKYNVSRTPVRHALSNLEKRGYLKRIPGKGTFSARKKRIYIHYPREFRDFNIEFAEINTRLSISQISREVIISDKELADVFHIKEGRKLLKVAKLLIMEEIPMAYGEDYFNVFSDTRLNELENFNIQPYKSIYTKLEELGFSLECGEEHFKAVNLTNEIATILKTDLKYAFYRERTMFLDSMQIFEHTKTYYVPDKYVYSLNLKKEM